MRNFNIPNFDRDDSKGTLGPEGQHSHTNFMLVNGTVDYCVQY